MVAMIATSTRTRIFSDGHARTVGPGGRLGVDIHGQVDTWLWVAWGCSTDEPKVCVYYSEG